MLAQPLDQVNACALRRCDHMMMVTRRAFLENRDTIKRVIAAAHDGDVRS